jgi:hypothetical protein
VFALLTQHPAALQHAVQYTPFTFPSLRNPCITLLGRTTNQPVLQLTFKQSNAALPETPQRWCVMQLQLLAIRYRPTAVHNDLALPCWQLQFDPM